MAKVTVIIPNYNHARYLPIRIDSVLNQTFTDFNVILMDDCSTDASLAILQQYEHDPRVRFILNDRNSGSTFKQWNKGVAIADGEYIWFAESDDYADRHFLERLVPILDAHLNVGIAYCASTVVDSDGATLRTTHHDFNNFNDRPIIDPNRWTFNFIASGRGECEQVLSRQNVIPNASAVLLRRSIYEQTGGADEAMRLNGDWKLYAAMLLRSDLAHVAEPLNFYRTHPQNVRTAMKRWTTILELANVIDFIRQNVIVPPGLIERHARWIADAWINSWLWQSLPEKSMRRQTFQAIQKIDPHFRRRVARRVIRRSVDAAVGGKIFRWLRHVFLKRTTVIGTS